MGDGARGDPPPDPGSAISARAAFAAATRGAWRAGGVRDGVTGTLVPGAPASYAVWEADEFEVQRPGRRRAALVDRPAVAGARPAETRTIGCRGAVRRCTEVSSSMAESSVSACAGSPVDDDMGPPPATTPT